MEPYLASTSSRKMSLATLKQGFPLLTTWDLFRLVRGFLANSWRHVDVAELFVTAGRMRPIPRHYDFIGIVDEYWAKASALELRLHSGSLRTGTASPTSCRSISSRSSSHRYTSTTIASNATAG